MAESQDGDSSELFNEATQSAIREELADWERNELAQFLDRTPERRAEWTTASGIPVRRLYTPVDVDNSYDAVGFPGRFPFTRGPYPTMYRGRPWTMRQIAGYGQASDTNQRFKYLIAQGQTGLSVDFDMPTLMGYDSDDPMSLGEVGREGVAIDILPDMEELFDGINLEDISVSMTINPSAWIILAMFVAVAEERGYDLNKLSGTTQNDILKEYIAQKEWVYPIRPSVRIVRDTITYCAQNMARFNPVNISGYHISEAGATAVQEAAFTMANARCYIEAVLESGLDVDEFAPRLSFYFVSQSDFFEEIAKFRAVRRYYARMMAQNYGAKRPDSMRLRFHTQTAAATLTKPQPLNNIVRTALQALAAVLGGAQSMHTNGLDEAFAIPSELAMKVALRTQQIIAEETRVTSVIDPIGGSYYVESLTDEIEHRIEEIIAHVEYLGGTIAAIEQGYFQREIADSAYEFLQRKATREQPVIGVNMYVDEGSDQEVEVHKIDPETEARQVRRLKAIRERRDEGRATAAIGALRAAAQDPSANLMPPTIEAVKAHVSMGEIVNSLKDIFGTYHETPVF